MQFFAFLVFLRLSPAFLTFQLFPRILESVSKFVFFSTHQIRSSNRISHPASSHEIFQQFSKSFAHFFRFIICFSEYFKVNIVNWLSKFPLSYFFLKFCVGFEVNFTFEFVIYIDTVERVSSLPKYYVCIRRACTACMSLQKQS